MFLMYSQNNNSSIAALLADAERRLHRKSEAWPVEPGCLHPNAAKALPEAVLLSGQFDTGSWFSYVEEEFWRRATGLHLELRPLFPSLEELLAGREFSLAGIPLTAVLGRGTDAAVYRTAAGKALKAAAGGGARKLRNEFRILRRISHPHVIRADELFTGETWAAICMEEIFPGIASESDYYAALREVHDCGLSHGDIRRTNLGKDHSGRGKLYDFGNASPLKENQASAETRRLDILFAAEAANLIKRTVHAHHLS